MRKPLLFLLLVIVLAAVAVAVAVGIRRSPASGSARGETVALGSNVAAESPKSTDGSGDGDEPIRTGLFRRIAQRQNPIVVSITTQSRVKNSDVSHRFGGDDFFGRFFGTPRGPREQLQQSLGSGFVISSAGEIVTNNHVVAGAERIRVALYGNSNQSYQADVVGRDPLTDSALIKLKDGPGNLSSAVLGNSDDLEPGDWVMAIGNPFQLGHTVTVGVISFKGRPFATTEGRFQNMLQTDASINPGNSGGPLINLRGEVIGINSAILSGEGGGGNIGIGFAVPINTLKNLLPQLRKGSVERGQLGVQILTNPITQDEASQFGLPKPEGAIISRVEPGSPADRAGLRAGDVVTQYNGNPVQDAGRLTEMVVNTPPDSRVSIVFYRDGRQQQATATVQQLELEASTQGREDGSSRAPGFGLSLGEVTPDVASQLRLPAGARGVLVENVEPFTPAASAGIKRGDVILEVNREAVTSSRDASRLLRSIGSGQPVFLLLWRQGTQQFVELRKE
jgi:serine protease Do